MFSKNSNISKNIPIYKILVRIQKIAHVYVFFPNIEKRAYFQKSLAGSKIVQFEFVRNVYIIKRNYILI